MAEYSTFISSKFIKPLLKRLLAIRNKREEELRELADIFENPVLLARYYIQPYCQHQNPADYNEEEPLSFVRSEVFKTINDFFNRELMLISPGRNTMFVLSDAGMGKTSLLLMLKLAHMTAFWPKQYDCILLKLGKDTFERVSCVRNKPDTILLLDSLDEDPLSWGRTKERLIELLELTCNFRRVLISCRTQFFPKTGLDPFEKPGRIEIGGYVSPMIFLSYFDEEQVDEYLYKRFPIRMFSVNDIKRSEAYKVITQMKSLQFRPLLLAHIEDLIFVPSTARKNIIQSLKSIKNTLMRKTDADTPDIENDFNALDGVFNIYNSLIRSWLLREEVKLRKQKIHSNSGQLFNGCLAVTEYMQETALREISEDILQNLVESDANVHHLKYFDFGGRSLLNRSSNGCYRFSHYSIQEFFATCLLINSYTNNKKYTFNITDQIFEFFISKNDRGYGAHKKDENNICIYCDEQNPSFESKCSFEILENKQYDDIQLINKDFNAAQIYKCSFKGSVLYSVKMNCCSIKSSSFYRSKIRNSSFDRALLREVDFKDASFDNCSFSGATIDMITYNSARTYFDSINKDYKIYYHL